MSLETMLGVKSLAKSSQRQKIVLQKHVAMHKHMMIMNSLSKISILSIYCMT